ncbi:MAG: hypothetical protein ACR2JY_15495 [Chloroflexota bacterium]
MNTRGRREATTRQKVVQVILGLLVFALFMLIALAVLIIIIKADHLGQR